MGKKKSQLKEMTLTQRAALISLAILTMIGGVWYLASLDIAEPAMPDYNFPIGLEDRSLLQQMLKTEITSLSSEKPRSSVERFTVTDFDYVSDRLVYVHYNDGLNYYIAAIDYIVEDDTDLAKTRQANVLGVEIVAEESGRAPTLDDALLDMSNHSAVEVADVQAEVQMEVFAN